STFAKGEDIGGLVGFGYDDGSVNLVRSEYQVTIPHDVRLITPSVGRPYGQAPIQLDPEGQAITHLSVQENTRGARAAILV
ncbi:hypothetical protein, partial [Klebsiella quasipneumoniae]|uniref:hypothetical protein n=1 Tax=Klebsiella quasipneumoniae TaxID=1463165 RepID=UPI002730270D